MSKQTLCPLILLLGGFGTPCSHAENAPVFTRLPYEASLVSSNGAVVSGTALGLPGGPAYRWTAQSGVAPLGPLKGGDVADLVMGISADGSIIAGRSTSEMYRWTLAGGAQGLGTVDTGGIDPASNAYLSSDGSTVVGIKRNNSFGEASRWTASTGITNGLGYLPGGSRSRAIGVSADGSVVVGLSDSAQGTTSQAFRWTASTGMVALGDLPGGALYSVPNFVSRDGSVVVGVSESAQGRELFRWTAQTGMVDLGDGSPTAISPDGSTIVGAATDGKSFRWSANGGKQSLGALPGFSTSYPAGVSGDGNIIVGSRDDASTDMAWVWDPIHGMKSLSYWLTLQGVDTGADIPFRALGISEDGSTVTGENHGFSWMASLPPNLVPEPGMVYFFLLGPIYTMGRRRRRDA